nr:DUF4837 family protein [Saprospiraceae bacterium]
MRPAVNMAGMGRFIFFSFLLLVSCRSDIQDRFRTTPSAIGKMQQLNLVVDSQLWQTSLRDSFAFYYQGAYLILPQPEPIYDVRVLEVDELLEDPIKRELKLFFKIANLADTNSTLTRMVINDLGESRIEESLQNSDFGVQIVRDKWARGQMIVYLYGKNIDALIDGTVRSFDRIHERIKEFYNTTIQAEVYGGGINRELTGLIRSKFNVNIDIPSNWVKAVEEDHFLWLREEQKNASLSLLFTSIPYEELEQLSREYLRNLRDSVTVEQISSGKEGSYMLVEDSFLPTFYFQYDLNGNYAIELRGIWDMYSDFMGGPFQSVLVLNEAENRLIFVDAFAYAPAENKRNHMIKLDYIIKTLDF